jgi:hypothetical protein
VGSFSARRVISQKFPEGLFYVCDPSAKVFIFTPKQFWKWRVYWQQRGVPTKVFYDFVEH